MSGDVERALGEAVAKALPGVPVYDSQGRRLGGLDIEGVLAAHVLHCLTFAGSDGRARWSAECLASGCAWNGTGTGKVPNASAAHIAHVAAVLREQIAAMVRSEREAFLPSPGLDRAWIAGWHSATDHIAALVAPSRVPGEET